MRVVRAGPAGTPDQPSPPTTTSLPAELVARASTRLSVIGMIAAATTVTMFFLQGWLQPEVAEMQRSWFVRGNAAGLVLISLALVAIQRFGWFSARVLIWIGMAYEIVGAFALAGFEHTLPWQSGTPVRGISWVAVWITVCGLLVPNTPRRSLGTGLAAAAMNPLAYLVLTRVFDHPHLSANRLIMWSFPPFLLAVWTAFLNHRLYRLEVDVTRAKETGSYELTERLGTGGMGEVWKARHRMLALNAAVKLIRAEVLVDQTSRQAAIIRRRFEKEARAIGALRSPHTVTLYDFGVAEDGSFYYVMELLDGINLETLVKKFGPQPPARVIHLLKQACDSLGEAHQLGLVHRDIKPTNMFICRLGLNVDFVKVLDFGLVKNIFRDGETSMTMDGMTTGTPAYMAPEVAMGSQEVDCRADVYGLGCLAYWLLTGQLVFDEATPVAMAIAHVQRPLVPPSQRTEVPIPPSLERVVLSCLEKNPDDRPPSASDLATMLEQCSDCGKWTRQDAQRWWQLNLPTSAPAPVSDEREAPAQA